MYGEWTLESRREFWSRFQIETVLVKPANRNPNIPVADRMAVKLGLPATPFWILPRGQWSREPFDGPDETSVPTSRSIPSSFLDSLKVR